MSCGKHLSKLASVGDCITNNPDFNPVEIPRNENYKLVVHEQATLSLFQNGDELVPEIDSGNMLVFEYQFQRPVKPGMTDAGYMEHILFETDARSENFVLNEADLQTAKAMYGNLCFCVDAGYHPVTGGCIKGWKSGDNEWHIEMNVQASGKNREFSKMLSEEFLIAD